MKSHHVVTQKQCENINEIAQKPLRKSHTQNIYAQVTNCHIGPKSQQPKST